MITTEESEDVNDEIKCQIMLLLKKLKRANVFQNSKTEVLKTEEKIKLLIYNGICNIGNVMVNKDASVHQLRTLSNIEFLVRYFLVSFKLKNYQKKYMNAYEYVLTDLLHNNIVMTGNLSKYKLNNGDNG